MEVVEADRRHWRARAVRALAASEATRARARAAHAAQRAEEGLRPHGAAAPFEPFSLLLQPRRARPAAGPRVTRVRARVRWRADAGPAPFTGAGARAETSGDDSSSDESEAPPPPALQCATAPHSRSPPARRRHTRGAAAPEAGAARALRGGSSIPPCSWLGTFGVLDTLSECVGHTHFTNRCGFW